METSVGYRGARIWLAAGQARYYDASRTKRPMASIASDVRLSAADLRPEAETHESTKKKKKRFVLYFLANISNYITVF